VGGKSSFACEFEHPARLDAEKLSGLVGVYETFKRFF
jgi:hypothetical protein